MKYYRCIILFALIPLLSFGAAEDIIQGKPANYDSLIAPLLSEVNFDSIDHSEFDSSISLFQMIY